MSLKRDAGSGVKWSSISQIGRHATQLVTTVVLAHLLSPSDFGLLGMAMVVVGFLGLFKDLGTSAAVIQRKKLSDDLLSSVFWTNAAFGLFTAVLLFFLAPLIADFYREPRITPVVRALSITFVVSGLSILQQAMLERDLLFSRLAKAEVVAVVVGAVLGIAAALLKAGVWSLVYQSLATAAATTVLLWAANPWRPRTVFRWAEMRSVASFSMNLVGFNVFNYFARNADYLLIGKCLGAQDLGVYTLAYRIMLYPLQSVSFVIARVMFPVFSQMQDDNERFGRTYLKVVGTIALITFPMMLGVMGISEPFVMAMFGPKWASVTILVKILAPVGLLQSIITSQGSIYQAKGRTDIFFRWGVGAGSLAVLGFVIGLKWGIVGVASAYAVVSIALAYPSFAIAFRLVRLPIGNLWTAVWRTLLSSLIMLSAIFAFRLLLPDGLSSTLTLAILVPVGILVYLFASWHINRERLRELLSLTGLLVGTGPLEGQDGNQ